VNIGKAPLLIAIFVAALFLLWEFMLAPMLGVAPHPPRQELQQGPSKR
jgi:hypothetical protein